MSNNQLPCHPAADLFPMMSPDELKVLAEDIKANGLLTPVTLWLDPETKVEYLLDGRNRCAASHLAGTGFPSAWTTSRDPYDYVLSANVHRRHLTAAQKRDVIAKLLKARPERSDRATAKDVGADHKTVGKVREELAGRGEIPHVDAVVDTKGRTQPTRKPKRKLQNWGSGLLVNMPDDESLDAVPTGATINDLPIKRVVENKAKATVVVRRWMKGTEEDLSRIAKRVGWWQSKGMTATEAHGDLREFVATLRRYADTIEQALDGTDESDVPPTRVKLSGGYVSVGDAVEFQDFPRKQWKSAKVTKITADGDGGVEVRVAAGGTLHAPYLAKLRRKAVKRAKRDRAVDA